MHRTLPAVRQLDHHQLSTPTGWAINDRQAAPKKRVVRVDNGNVSDSPIYVYGIMKYSAIPRSEMPSWTALFTVRIGST